MPREIVSTPHAPSSPVFSQAVKAGPTIYVSGMTGVDVSTGKVAGPTIQDQTRQALENCGHILEAAGATLDDVVEVQALLTRPEDFAGFNEAYASVFPASPPARSVSKLGVEIPSILISIRMTAYVNR